ncbi:MAG: outer membrane beta-barrel protein [Saprospiraceae bacterium]
MKKWLFLPLLLSIVFSLSLAAQPPGGGGGRMDRSRMSVGRIYGKVVDENGKGVGYATVQLMGKTFDRQTRSLVDTIWAGQLTEDNGDFNIEKLPVVGEYTLIINFLGYAATSLPVDFGMPRPMAGPGGAPSDSSRTNRPASAPSAGFANMSAGNFEKDLGNIQLVIEAATLGTVTVTGEAAIASLSIDRKSFRVDKDLSAQGGTAEDALKNVPSVSVDLDGNVSLRNGAPQVFVDGRPTTLSLDQISADAIESVEVITNPSAKYDAGGGTAGIINIVLKKDKRLGYNGNLRIGTDSQGSYNVGGDLNARGGKFNLFGSGMLMQNRRLSEGQTARNNFFESPASYIFQTSESVRKGGFANVRGGVDYFIDNRNTLTVSGSFVRGKFKPEETILNTTDLLYPDAPLTSSFTRVSNQERMFRNVGATLQFKHLFPKKGAEWTADAGYNNIRFEGGNDVSTLFNTGTKSQERQDQMGSGGFITLQTDFINPIGDKAKIEGGLKAVLRDNANDNMNFVLGANDTEWQPVTQFTDHFKYNDNVFAAYLQGSRQYNEWGIQAGLRAESSVFNGKLTDRDSSFSISYPISLFPSLFISRQLNETDQVQLAYTRRINRPNFFQTMPFTDFSDSLNLRRGEPGLLPEFTNSLELSWQKIFNSGTNLLVSVYYKQATNLITSYQFTEFNTDINRQIVITSYANSRSANAYGAEFTLKNKLFKWMEITSNLNVYQSDVDASNVETNLTVSRMSAFLKETIQMTLNKNYSFQLNGEYRTRAAFTPSSGNDNFRGPHGGSQNTAQGYTREMWFIDASMRRSLLKNKGFLTLSISDIFATRKQGSFTSTEFFTQDSWNLRQPQVLRLNFMYRFGKMDTSLFNRKNTRMNDQGNDMMGG